MAKASKFESFHGDVCEALRNRANHYSRAIKHKDKAEGARDEAKEQMRGVEGAALEKLEADFGRHVLEIEAASKAATWAKNEILSLIENADDEKLFADVVIKAAPPKPKSKDEDPEQMELKEDPEEPKAGKKKTKKDPAKAE